MIVNGSKLAHAAGCTRANVANEFKKGLLTRDAKGKYNTTDPINSAWLRARGVNPENLTSLVGADAEKIRQTHKRNPGGRKGKPKPRDAKPEPPPASEPEPPRAEILPAVAAADFETLTGLPERLGNLTLRQLAMQYGAQMQLKGYVDILNTLMAAQKKDVEIQERRNILIEKDFVSAHLFQYLDIMHNQLFDWPESAIDDFIAKIKADEKAARLQVPEKMRKDFSRMINEARKNIKRELKKLNSRHNNDSTTEV